MAKQESIIIEPQMNEPGLERSSSRVERRQKMKRFRQLPEMKIGKLEESEERSSGGVNEASMEHFIDMEDLSPIKKRS